MNFADITKENSKKDTKIDEHVQVLHGKLVELKEEYLEEVIPHARINDLAEWFFDNVPDDMIRRTLRSVVDEYRKDVLKLTYAGDTTLAKLVSKGKYDSAHPFLLALIAFNHESRFFVRVANPIFGTAASKKHMALSARHTRSLLNAFDLKITKKLRSNLDTQHCRNGTIGIDTIIRNAEGLESVIPNVDPAVVDGFKKLESYSPEPSVFLDSFFIYRLIQETVECSRKYKSSKNIVSASLKYANDFIDWYELPTFIQGQFADRYKWNDRFRYYQGALAKMRHSKVNIKKFKDEYETVMRLIEQHRIKDEKLNGLLGPMGELHDFFPNEGFGISHPVYEGNLFEPLLPDHDIKRSHFIADQIGERLSGLVTSGLQSGFFPHSIVKQCGRKVLKDNGFRQDIKELSKESMRIMGPGGNSSDDQKRDMVLQLIRLYDRIKNKYGYAFGDYETWKDHPMMKKSSS